MKKNKKYLKAAKFLVSIENTDPQGCCLALGKVNHPSDKYWFELIFKPQHSHSDDYYFGPVHCDESKLARSLALLFMYEMGEP